MKIFCLTIYNENYELFKKLKLIPVGLGTNNFDEKWLTDKININISNKNKHFGEFTFHYYLWKNQINHEKNNDWIGFCTYRRFWIKKNFIQPKNYQELTENILNEPDKSWINKDVILVEPLIFNKVKNIKMLKRNFLEILKKPSILFKRTSLKDQFNVFHGSYFLKEAINFLNHQDKINFSNFLNGYELNPYNMFICRNSEILNQFYNEIFPWLFKCEELFKNKNLIGYDQVRIYGFLAERYMSYWFKNNTKTLNWPVTFLDTHVL